MALKKSIKKKTKKRTKNDKSNQSLKLKFINSKQTLAEKLNIKEEILRFVFASFLVFFAIFLIAAIFDYAGVVGNFLFNKLYSLFGYGYYVLPILFIFIAFISFRSLEKNFTKIQIFGAFLFVLSSLGFIELVLDNGGYLGKALASIQNLIGYPMSILFSIIIFIISNVVMFDFVPQFKSFRKREKKYSQQLSEEEEEKIDETAKRVEGKTGEAEEKPKKAKPFSISFSENKKAKKEENEMTKKILDQKNTINKNVILPPLNLLTKQKGKIDAGDIKKNANIIKNTLASFGIGVEIEDVAVGPTVTRYSLSPKAGVKVSRISALSDDLALALAAKSILVEAPIPGQSLVGIEIPNKNKITVGARELFESDEFKYSKYDMPIAIGKDIGGKTQIIGLEKTPHMLIAGATGSGKSVTVHAILNSLLFKHGPDTLKLILVDPKRVEMTLYNNIPHLLTPVIVDAKKAILALRWAVKEMERRYEVLEKYHLRDIGSYHKNIVDKIKNEDEDKPELMPYIVFVIDELADIMQQYPKELEAGIVSIAQKARAVGIHLILSTQRPSVNVVTGLIKANIPTRIALQVSSAIDSKTILDKAGAEKLLGQGDMLYLLGNMPKPIRVQSSFISENEVKSIVKFIKKAYKEYLEEEINFSNNNDTHAQEVVTNTEIDFSDDADFDADPLLSKAKDEVVSSGKASTSYLQRRLGIGYSRAAKLIDLLEEKGIVGPSNGSKPREVLLKKD